MPENGNNGVENVTPITGQDVVSTNPMNEIPTEPSPVTTSYEVDYSSKKNKKNLLPVIIIGALVALLVIAAIAYTVITSNPKNLLKGAINKVYSEFSDSLEVYDDTIKELKEYKIDLKDPISVNADLQVRGSLFDLNKIKDNKISIAAGIDAGNKKMEATAKIEESGKDLFNGSAYIKDDKLYFTSDQVLNNMYYFDLNSADYSDLKESFYEIFDSINGLEQTEFNMEELLKDAPKSKDIDEIGKELKDALISSLNEEYITKTKEEIEINDLTVKATKVSYDLNKASVKDLMTTFAETVLDNTDLIKKIAKLLDVEDDEVKEIFKSLKDKDNYEDFEGSGEFSIYFSGLIKKSIRVEVEFDGVTISYSNYKDNLYFVVKEKESDMKFEVIGVTKDDVTEIDIKMNKEKIGSAKVKQLDEKVADVEFSIDYDGIKFNSAVRMEITGDNSSKVEFSISADDLKSLGFSSYDLDDMDIDNYKDVKLSYVVEAKNVSPTSLDYKIDFDVEYKDLDGKKQDVGATMNLGLRLNGDVASANTSKALNAGEAELTDEETTKAQKFLEDFEKSNFYKYIQEIGDIEGIEDIFTNEGEVVTNPNASIYDDEDCFDAYLDDYDFSGTYAEYYNQYCIGS